jgi:hypothetical protein
MFQIDLFGYVEETHVSLGRNHVFSKKVHLTRCFPVKTELGFKEIRLTKHSIQGGERLILAQIGN